MEKNVYYGHIQFSNKIQFIVQDTAETCHSILMIFLNLFSLKVPIVILQLTVESIWYYVW